MIKMPQVTRRSHRKVIGPVGEPPPKKQEETNIFKLVNSPPTENKAPDPWVLKECEQLSFELGIDWPAERPKFEWFLLQLCALDLPIGWAKEENLEGAVIYYNKRSNYSIPTHPCLRAFRQLFSEYLRYFRPQLA